MESLYAQLAIKAPLQPVWTHQFTGLIEDKHVTNCSLIRWQGRLLLAYRVGWFGARIYVAELSESFEVQRNTLLQLEHPLAVGGQEDPRLFVHNDELCLSFIGVRLTRHEATIARQLFARLGDNFQPVETWEPKYLWTTQWEKNWQPFSLYGQLFCVYSVNPWRIVELKDGKAEPVLFGEAMQLDEAPAWGFGHLRGGAAPVRVGDEFYCFVHGTDKTKYDDGFPAQYTMGVVTFDARTLRPVRCTPEPILWPDMSDFPAGEHGGKHWYAATCYPCGAFLEAGKFVVSYGHNDHWCRASAFDAADIEGRLQCLT